PEIHAARVDAGIMHRALSSLAWVFIVLPACGDTSPADEPLGGGQGGTGGVVDPSTSGDVDGSEGSEESGRGGSAGGLTSGGGSSGGSSGGSAVEGFCGDGILEAGESCDDGNVDPGDGCDADCTPSEGVVSFSVGNAHTCAVSFEGRVRCFGGNAFGQLGIGSTEMIGDDETPLAVGFDVELPPVTQVSAGARHTCAVTAEHEVYCWGANESGQLGLGHDKTWGDAPDEPLEAVELGGLVAAVEVGAAHTCARLFGGTVTCWGDSSLGQLGHGGGFSGTVGGGAEPYPRVIDGPAVDFGPDAVVRELSVGRGDHTCAMSGSGALYCWGSAGDGKLGTGPGNPAGLDRTPAEAGPIRVGSPVRLSVVSTLHTCAVTTDFQLSCFGNNDSGQLGLGHLDTIGDDETPEGVRVDLGDEFVLNAALSDRSTCALTSHGTVFCWGTSNFGQLGSGSSDVVGDDELPIDWDGFGPVKLFGETTAVAAGSEHVCARSEDSRLRCWGRGDDGRLGQGDPELGAHGDDVDEREPLVVRIFR
ncbi:MAG: hypothetical protein KUG77_11200, partial [Nannocystaceae bacterium]|nr:hypothetical protein [Nannocystaceae bacterium]